MRNKELMACKADVTLIEKVEKKKECQAKPGNPNPAPRWEKNASLDDSRWD